MTAKSLLTALLPLVSDLSRELPEGERYRRLLEAMRALLPCDAAALLRIDGEWLVPLAVDGLSTDTLGRRFKISEHPRFEALLSSPGPTRFAADSDLPDPYDGLVDGLEEHLEVHDCIGCPLFIDERPWGLLTLDALDPERFEPIELDALQAFASLAAATVNAAERIERLANRVEDEHQRAEVYRQASGQQNREMIGQSKAHKRLVEEINLVGGSDLTVLITGETGVGKELVAQAIHAASPRADKPIISLNCAALPETLVESELFGHVRGAFTGAMNDRRGKFELANGGTLFLDEVGELSLTVQAKLLRVLAKRSATAPGVGQGASGRRAIDCRDQPRPGRGSAPRSLPCRLLPSAECLPLAGAGIARSRARCVAAQRLFSGAEPLAHGAQQPAPEQRRPGCTAGLYVARERAGAGALDRPQCAESLGQLQGTAEDPQLECGGSGFTRWQR